MKGNIFIIFFVWMDILASCSQKNVYSDKVRTKSIYEKRDSMRKATFGGGCFWCVEAIYQNVDGVSSVVSGYSGGHIDNPNYQQVSSGKSGHAEVVQISYDPNKVSYETILEIFWKIHDPTTLNRQGNDIGSQYRSIILYHDEEQKGIAIKSKKALEESGFYKNPVVTEIVPLKQFYMAEDYHQNYFKRNPEKSYCQFVVEPKVEKFTKLFKEKLRK